MNRIATLIAKFKSDKLGFTLLVLSYIFVFVSIVAMPIFTYRENYTFIVNILCAISSLFIVIYIFFRGKFYINHYILFLVLFLIYGFFVTLFTTKTVGFRRFKSILLIYAFVFCLIELWFNKKSNKFFVISICVSIAIFSAMFIYTYRENVLSFNLSKRFGEDYGNMNTLCSIFIFGAMFFTYIALKYKKWALLLFIPVAIITFCALMTGSRWGFATLIFSFVIIFYEIVGRKHKFEFFLIALLIIAISIGIIQLPPFATLKKSFDEIINFINGTSIRRGSTSVRFAMFTDGLRLWFKNAFIGYGCDGFLANTSYGMYSHSTIIELLTNYGLIGFILFFTPLILLVLNSNKNKLNDFSFFARGFVIVFIFYSVFAICHYSKFGILCLSIFVGNDFWLNKDRQTYLSIQFFDNKAFDFGLKIHLPELSERLAKDKLKIGLVLSSLDGCDEDKVAVILANYWAEFGHNVIIFCHKKEKVNSSYLIPTIKVVNVWNKYKLNFLPSFVTNDLVNSINADKPDILVSFSTMLSYCASFAARTLNIPFVCSECTKSSESTKAIKKLLKKKAFSNANHIVFYNKENPSKYSKIIQQKSSVFLKHINFNKIDNLSKGETKISKNSDCYAKNTVRTTSIRNKFLGYEENANEWIGIFNKLQSGN